MLDSEEDLPHTLQQENPEALTKLNEASTSIKTRASIISNLDFAKLKNQKYQYQKDILASLGACDQVQQLTLLNCKILTDELFKQIIAYFPSLKMLKITGCSRISGGSFFTDNGIRAIGGLQKLEKLYADNIQRIRTFKITQNMPELKLVQLNNCPQLTTIEFKAPKLTKISACNCPELNPKSFNVSANKECTAELNNCGKFSELQKILKSHFFEESQIHKFFLKHLESLLENERRTKLSLIPEIKSNSEVIRLLCLLLGGKIIPITEINLLENQIANEGAIAIAKPLKINTTIKKISLWYNNIGPKGGQALAEALKDNKTVTEINLGGNDIADAELKVIKAYLLRNVKLKETSASYNRDNSKFSLFGKPQTSNHTS